MSQITPASELDRFWREMAPVPGRMAGSLRFALMSALATLLLLILQPAVIFIAPAMFMLFLVSHETPARCFWDLIACLGGAGLGSAAALLLVIATGNHPVARILGLVVYIFLAAFFFRTFIFPAFPMAFGTLAYMVISLWENNLRPERILHLSLWPMGTLGIVALSAMGVECLFHRGDSANRPAAARATRPSGGSWKDSLQRLFLPDAFTNEDHLFYALKLSLCVTICYVIYIGLRWPGIYNSVFTVYFTGLSTTGTTNRKLLFRLIGSALGGMLLGLGCLVYVFPNMEGVTGFLLVIAAVSFLGAWAAASPYFGYIGFQTAFAFNLLAFERLRAPDQMTPARDRLLGIALGFAVMFVIFHQVRPERTVDTMRRLLVRVLRARAELIRTFAMDPSAGKDGTIARITRTIKAAVGNLENFAHAVKFEFPPDCEADIRTSHAMLNATAISESLSLCVRNWPQEPGSTQETQRLREAREGLEKALQDLAAFLEIVPEKASYAGQTAPNLPVQEAAPICAVQAFDKLQELRLTCEDIVRPEQIAVPVS